MSSSSSSSSSPPPPLIVGGGLRPNGTSRRVVRVRAGFKSEETVAGGVYKPAQRVEREEREREAREQAAEEDGSAAAQAAAQAARQQKRDRRKANRKAQWEAKQAGGGGGEEEEEEEDEGGEVGDIKNKLSHTSLKSDSTKQSSSATVPASISSSSAAPSSAETLQVSPSENDPAKRLKAANKKLRQIELLEQERDSNGKILTKEEEIKLSKKQALIEEIEALKRTVG